VSIAVLSRVMGNFHPESEVAERLVLVVLADAAHDDGITWISQEEIANKSRLSVRHVGRCIKALDDRLEIETRKAQRGRRRINVCRVSLAPLEPDYDRLPFALTEDFTTNLARERDGSLTGPSYGSTKGQDPENDRPCPVVDDDDVRSSLATTGHDVRSSGPPPVWLDGKDNLPLNALLEALAIDPKSPRVKLAATVLNGRKGKPEEGIRGLFWIECCRYAEQAGRLADLADLHDDPETFARLLAARIPQKVRRIHNRDPWRTGLAPAVLRDLWLDVELGGGDGDDRVLTPEEIEKFGSAS
jgi:hypothetical protein